MPSLRPQLHACLLAACVPSIAAALALHAADAHAQAQDAVTIYRCTDAQGRLTLRDSPCPKGNRQETRTMARPKDAPPRPAQPVAPTPAAPAPAPQVIVVNTPRPMYECTAPDGNTYTSDSPEGNPRFVPLWTLGYPVVREGVRVRPASGTIRYSDGKVDGGFSSGGFAYERRPTLAGYGAGTWVRDTCNALPQQETCARLADRRDAIRKRFFNAMPSERAELDIEERGINARLGSDCRGPR